MMTSFITIRAAEKAGEVKIFQNDGKGAGYRVVCDGISAYDALTAVAKFRRYELNFDEAAAKACRSVILTGVFGPWGKIEAEGIIVEFVNGDANLPYGHFLEIVKSGRRKPRINIIVVNHGGHGELDTTLSGLGHH